MFWIATLLFLWEYEFIGGTPYVAVVGGNAYLNWTINNLSNNETRYIRNPVGNASVMVFFSNELMPYIFDNRTTFTGDLLKGVVSFQFSNVKLSDAGKYTFTTNIDDPQATLGSQVLVVADSPNISGITSLSLPAVAGKEYKINCSTESRSAPLDHNLTMYSKWRANGFDINMGSGYSLKGTILTIINLTREDNGAKFTCRAFEDQRRISGESSALVLNVLYGPDNVRVSPSGELTVGEGDSINITCTGECNPPCSTYQWQKDYLPAVVGSSQSYVVPNIKRNHSGVYICIASNTNISKNAIAQIIVRVNYGPDAGSITLSPNQTSYETEESLPLSVNCSADCYPSCQYNWTGPGVCNYGNTGVLFIPEIKRNQTGLFQCTATNPIFTSTSAATTIYVAVLYGPDADSITLSPNQISFEQVEFSSFSVKCSANCYRDCRYRWRGPEVGDYGNTGVISIPEIKRDEAGIFTCTATNPGITSKSATATISVTVLYPPTVRIEGRNGSVSEMEFMINCTAHGIPERYNYSLIHISLFSGTKIQQLIDNEPSSTGVLVHWLRNPSFMDTGVYTCIVRNGIMDYRDSSVDKNASVSVWIKGPPNVTSSDTVFYAEKGRPGRLVIEFYNSLLNATVTWKKQRNNTLEKLESYDKYNISVASTNVTVKFYSVLIQQPGFITTLEIQNVTEEDFSPYQVYLQNSAGNSSKLTLNLKPRGPPDVPTDFHIVLNSITTSSMDIEWVSGFHGGSYQTFVIEYKTQEDESWTNYSHAVFGAMAQNTFFNITIEDLQQNTLYFFQLYAWNMFNRSKYSTIINATTYAESNKRQIANNRADEVIIGGAVGAVVLLSIAVTVVIILYRRRSIRKLNRNGKPLELDVRSEEKNDRESGLVDNPVYEASDARLNPSASKGTTVAEYAAVDKTKKKAVLIEDPSNLYAQVDKTNKNGKKGAAKGKHGKTSRGDIYENIDLGGKTIIADSEYENSRQPRTEAFDGNVNENPGAVASKSGLVNKDGLLYADLMLGPSTTKNGKVVIHGIENRTKYADIAYGKRGEPYPDSDEDKIDGMNVKK